MHNTGTNADTAYYGVDIDYLGDFMIVAVGMTKDPKLMSNSDGE